MSKGFTAGVAALSLLVMLAFAGADQVSGDAGTQDQAGEGAQLYGIDAPEVAQAQAQAPDCLVKGNISKSGERIYHVPGGQFYDRTKINEAAGERIFCSEKEAVAAGWRRSLR
jgi:hypothetical protein